MIQSANVLKAKPHSLNPSKQGRLHQSIDSFFEVLAAPRICTNAHSCWMTHASSVGF